MIDDPIAQHQLLVGPLNREVVFRDQSDRPKAHATLTIRYCLHKLQKSHSHDHDRNKELLDSIEKATTSSHPALNVKSFADLKTASESLWPLPSLPTGIQNVKLVEIQILRGDLPGGSLAPLENCNGIGQESRQGNKWHDGNHMQNVELLSTSSTGTHGPKIGGLVFHVYVDRRREGRVGGYNGPRNPMGPQGGRGRGTRGRGAYGHPEEKQPEWASQVGPPAPTGGW